jgi:hypothetical protein
MKACLVTVCAIAALQLLGCEKKEPPAQVATETPVAPAPPPAAPPPTSVAEPTIDASTLAVEEQYEADAERDITVENVAAKVDELEKEIAAP